MLGFLIKTVVWDFITVHISQVSFFCFRTSRLIRYNKLKPLLLVSPFLLQRCFHSSKKADGLVGGNCKVMSYTLTIIHS